MYCKNCRDFFINAEWNEKMKTILVNLISKYLDSNIDYAFYVKLNSPYFNSLLNFWYSLSTLHERQRLK